MTKIFSEGVDPFDALDTDWASLCRRHRRSGVVQRWAGAEPALAGVDRLGEVIPPPSVDRGPTCMALARLHRTGDDLAGRALLQLCVPGLMYLAARWRPRMQGENTAAWEVVTRAGIYIARLRNGDIHCRVGVAGYLIRSVHRDLVLDARRLVQRRDSEVPIERFDDEAGPTDRVAAAPSAEDVVCADLPVRSALQAATRAGVVPLDAARVLWLLLAGKPMAEASQTADRSVAAIYRHRVRTYRHLYDQLFLDTPMVGLAEAGA